MVQHDTSLPDHPGEGNLPGLQTEAARPSHLAAVISIELPLWVNAEDLVEARRSVRVTMWSIEVGDPEDDSARAAVRAYAAELDELLGASSPTIADPDPGAYREPRGMFLVVVDDTEVVGCAGLRVIEVPPYGQTAEVKRMWVSMRLRGQGVGRALLERLHTEARRRGLRRVVLDSKRELLDARRLYLAAGYRDIDPYGDNEDATAWMGLRLDGTDWVISPDA